MTASDPSKMSHTPGVFFGFGLVLLGLALCQVFVNIDLHNVTQQSLQASKKAFTQGKYGPKIQPRLSQSNNDTDNNPPKYHLVFSTSCTDQQDWESFVFFYHAARVQQPGTVTRIVSGCDARQAREVLDFFHRHIAPLSVEGNFHVHLTPDYGKVALARGHYYKYMNKPFGLRHWMEHWLRIDPTTSASHDPAVQDDIVILMDPDMILLRPITHDFSDTTWHRLTDHPLTRVVRHGYPMAQQDGYLNNKWMELDLDYITNRTKDQHQTLPPAKDGPLHWNTGPPYLATVRDMYQIAVKWTEYAPRVVDIHPELFAEMYGFIFATVELQLPFTLVKSIVVSVTTTPIREGWEFIDALKEEDVCDPPSDAVLPIVLHYCKRYCLGKHFLSKYRIKKNIMACEKALLKPPPKDLATQKLDYAIFPPRADLKDKDTYTEVHSALTNTKKQPKREAFMLCALTKYWNEAFAHLKKHACGDRGNLSESYTIYDDPLPY